MVRINAVCRMYNISYLRFMYVLKVVGVELDCKVLVDMVMNDM